MDNFSLPFGKRLRYPRPKPGWQKHLVMTTSDFQTIESDFARYKMIRDEISHEDNLMGSRVSWFMASQSFLLTALAIAQGAQPQSPNAHINFFFPLLPIVAIVSDLLILAGVLAGIAVLRRWRKMLDEAGPRFETFPRIRRDNVIMNLGWSGPIGLQLIFLVAWLYLLWVGL